MTKSEKTYKAVVTGERRSKVHKVEVVADKVRLDSSGNVKSCELLHDGKRYELNQWGDVTLRFARHRTLWLEYASVTIQEELQ